MENPAAAIIHASFQEMRWRHFNSLLVSTDFCIFLGILEELSNAIT
jgi:hypothetical protein